MRRLTSSASAAAVALVAVGAAAWWFQDRRPAASRRDGALERIRTRLAHGSGGGGGAPAVSTPSFVPTRPASAGVRVLVIDGGGIRGIVALRILQALKEKTHGKEPYQLFDLICGTSTGGILAILLGVLRVPLDDCVAIYEELGHAVFDVGPAAMWVHFVRNGSWYSGEAMEQAIKAVVEARLGAGTADIRLNDARLAPPFATRVFVVASRTQDGRPYLLRNYDDTDDVALAGTHTLALWQAVRATSAASLYFPALTVDRTTYVDGGIGTNNPSLLMLTELKRIVPWKHVDVATVVSLGTGLPVHTQNKATWSGAKNLVVNAATDSERTHGYFDSLRPATVRYTRLNPGNGIGSVPLDRVDEFVALREATENYLAQPDELRKLDALAAQLLGTVTRREWARGERGKETAGRPSRRRHPRRARRGRGGWGQTRVRLMPRPVIAWPMCGRKSIRSGRRTLRPCARTARTACRRTRPAPWAASRWPWPLTGCVLVPMRPTRRRGRRNTT
jgi:predicted acylesterase/phospholipase RssA